MRVLITGSAGKIGRVVGRELHDQGHEVLGVDRGFRPDMPYHQRVGDLLEPFFFERVFESEGNFDAVVHLANIPNVRAGRTPAAVLSENLAMSGLVFGVARERGVKRILYSSSIQAALPAYNDADRIIDEHPPDRLPIDENTPPIPSNTYGLSKLLAEQMLERMCTEPFSMQGSSISGLAFRLPWVTTERGMRWRYESMTSRNEHFTIVDACLSVMEEDVARAFRLGLEADLEGYRCYWICSPKAVIRQEVFEELMRGYAEGHPDLGRVLERGGLVNTSKAEQELGWRGQTVDEIIASV